jgi:hypothetical protein
MSNLVLKVGNLYNFQPDIQAIQENINKNQHESRPNQGNSNGKL